MMFLRWCAGRKQRRTTRMANIKEPNAKLHSPNKSSTANSLGKEQGRCWEVKWEVKLISAWLVPMRGSSHVVE